MQHGQSQKQSGWAEGQMGVAHTHTQHTRKHTLLKWQVLLINQVTMIVVCFLQFITAIILFQRFITNRLNCFHSHTGMCRVSAVWMSPSVSPCGTKAVLWHKQSYVLVYYSATFFHTRQKMFIQVYNLFANSNALVSASLLLLCVYFSMLFVPPQSHSLPLSKQTCRHPLYTVHHTISQCCLRYFENGLIPRWHSYIHFPWLFVWAYLCVLWTSQ